MKYIARLTELTLEQLGKKVLVEPKKYIENPKYIMNWSIPDENKQAIQFNSVLEVFVALINAGYVPTSIITAIKNIKKSQGFEKNIEAVKYYIQANPDVAKVLQNVVDGPKEAEKLDTANAVSGKNTNSNQMYAVSKKVKDK